MLMRNAVFTKSQEVDKNEINEGSRNVANLSTGAMQNMKVVPEQSQSTALSQNRKILPCPNLDLRGV